MIWPFTLLRARRTAQEQRILDALGDGELSGYQITQRANIGLGLLHCHLMRMERDGTLTSRWGDRTAEGNRRRLYRRKA